MSHPSSLSTSLQEGSPSLTSRAFHSPPVRNNESRSRDSSIPHVHRGRQPSVGEVYQEMEQEQEAQVNRLLQTIRLQQNQIQALQNRSDPSQQPDGVSTISETSPLFGASGSEHVIPHSPVPTVERNRRLSQISPAPVRSVPTGFQLSQHLPLEQESAILSSGRATPSLPTPTSSVSGAAKIEVAFYQAENQTLNRENQRLRSRIRELERQLPAPRGSISDLSTSMNSTHLSQEQQVDQDVAPDEAR